MLFVCVTPALSYGDGLAQVTNTQPPAEDRNPYAVTSAAAWWNSLPTTVVIDGVITLQRRPPKVATYQQTSTGPRSCVRAQIWGSVFGRSRSQNLAASAMTAEGPTSPLDTGVASEFAETSTARL